MIAQKQKGAILGRELAFVDEGEGPAVVLLHGFPGTSFVWRDLMPMLSAQFRVVAPDLLGCGDSDRPRRGAYDLRSQAGYVAELLASLGVDRFAVVGERFGGGVAQLLALDHRGVGAMVLLNPIALDRWPSARGRDAQATPAEDRTPEWVAEGIRSYVAEGSVNRPLDGSFLDGLLRTNAGPDGARAFSSFLDAFDGEGLVGREDQMASWEFPVLILWGEDDPFVPVEVAEELSEAIPSSTLGVLPGCGHFLTEEAPETVFPMIHEYLRARYAHAPHRHADASGIVTLQLERRPPWAELAELETEDEEPRTPDPEEQEVGPGA